MLGTYKVITPFNDAWSTIRFLPGDQFEAVYISGVVADVEYQGLSSVVMLDDLKHHCNLLPTQLPKGLYPRYVIDDDLDLDKLANEAANFVGDFSYSDVYGNETQSVGPQCECGQKGVEYAIHSDYCPLYKKSPKN